ncbi:MAG: glycosyltransferase family 2 protein [Solirubrobacteraceae bacterium]
MTEDSTSALVGAIVLAHNGAQDTVKCLRSLRDTTWPNLRTFVVDNASSDDTAAIVGTHFPEVTLVRSDRNLGYAGGNNLGIECALQEGCDYLLVLNNDTFVEPSTIHTLVASAQEGSTVGAVVPLITYLEYPEVIWYAGGDYDPRRGYPGRMRHYRARISDVTLAPGPTDRFSGAAVLLPASVVEQVGGFSEDLGFLYEDVDLSLRIRAVGLDIWFAPDAVVRHRVAMTQRGEHSTMSFYYGVRNQLRVGELHAPLRFVADARRRAVTIAVHLARVRRANQRRAAVAAVLRGVRDHRHARFGYTPPRIAGKP